MLLPYLKVLNKKNVILGSQSKTRNELMTAQRLIYKVIPSKFQENLDKKAYEHPQDYNLDTCKGKVEELLSRFKAENIDWDLLICGDTIVEHKGVIIQKPVSIGQDKENYEHCVQMIKDLAGQTHRVYTTHAVIFNIEKYTEGFEAFWVQRVQATFGEIPQEVIAQFAKDPEPYIHSGGYELTAMSGSFVKSINGSHSALQGLDMYAVCSKIIEGGKKLKWF